VLATTRFPQDAQKRYAAEPDSDQWLGRLQIIGADFRFLAGVEAMCAELCNREVCLDVIVNNACQTVRRPAAYYAHLLTTESPSYHYPSLEMSEASASSLDARQLTSSGSAALSQLLVVEQDGMKAEKALAALPPGARDVHGQQLDLRSTNSWLLKLGEVETPEAVEVFCINAMAPFIINSRLRPLMERASQPDRYIINVSAMEGKFYRYKQPTHPHTNMAKAALNMMTRTSAEELASNGIYMNSVDTGWINDENPLPLAQRIAEDHQFQTPIDEIDAAARILDPVLTGMEAIASGGGNSHRSRKSGSAGGSHAAGPPWGIFLKDYKQTEW